jgi:hypothetical protein
MFFSTSFFLAGACFIFLLNKRRWRSSLVIGTVALALALIAELIGQVYPTWDFVGNEKWLFISLANALVYTLCACLFIQWYPFHRSRLRRSLYWIIWTAGSVALEGIYLRTGHMKYFENWSLWHSYCADWFLYWLYFKAYTILRLDRLDR